MREAGVVQGRSLGRAVLEKGLKRTVVSPSLC